MQPSELPRRLGLTDVIAIVVGVIVGAGIFLVPSLVARSLPSPSGIFAVWAFGGLLSLCGALAMAELGAMMPATGGQYVFLREAYGPMIAFLCGWTHFLVSQSAAIAWLGVSFAIYLGYFVPVSPVAGKAIGIGLIGIIAMVNYRGVRLGAGVQKAFTAAKVLGLAVLIGSALFAKPAASAAVANPVAFTWSAFGIGVLAVLLSYDGWTTVGFVAGEIREPQKNVARALFIGVVICMAIYLSANWAYLRVFTPAEMGASDRIGADLGQRTLGSLGGTLVTLTILISIAGSMNGWLMTQPRVYFAQARDGLFFRQFGEIHPRFQTPGPAIILQFCWAAVLILSGSFDVLISYAMFAMWLFYALTVGGVVILRWKRPDAPRPYRMWGYPVTPVVFVLVALWFEINTLIERPGPSSAALGIILAGVPAYFFWSRRRVGTLAAERL